MYDKIKKLNKDKKGLVGIGTLIIFIAMVIVAAVAAGVLINTSQSLQEQARATGEETIREVSSGVQVSAVKGQTDSEDRITTLEAVVSTYPGSDGINLNETVIQVTTKNNMEHVTSDNFTVNKIENVSNTANNLLGPGDTVQITVDNANLSGSLALEGGDEASLTFIPPEGFDTYYGVNVPTVLRKNTWYEM